MNDFKQGDTVYHSHFGTGTITDTRIVGLGGSERACFVVELVEAGVLIIPCEELGETRLHALISLGAIEDVFAAPPEDLPAEHIRRREQLAEKVTRGDPTQVAEALRDLAWRDHTAKLSPTDKTFMATARKLLADMLDMQVSSVDAKPSARQLKTMLTQTAKGWEATA